MQSLNYKHLRIRRWARKWVFSQAAQRETPLRSPSYLCFTQVEFFCSFCFLVQFVRRVLVLARRSRATCIYTSTRLTVKSHFLSAFWKKGSLYLIDATEFFDFQSNVVIDYTNWYLFYNMSQLCSFRQHLLSL